MCRSCPVTEWWSRSDEAGARATQAMCDACVVFGPKCDCEVRVEDEATTVAGEIVVTGEVGYDLVVRVVRRESPVLTR